MAIRPAFIVRKGRIESISCDFQWYPGFAISQKRKSIQSMHDVLISKGYNPLEISTKSCVDIGVLLSAFNLQYDGKYIVENVFQSAKISQEIQTDYDILKVSPKESKARSHDHGKLIGFKAYDSDFQWPLEPKTAFYEFIYVKALISNKALFAKIKDYDAFTDIEFNPQKSINCQARAVAVAKIVSEGFLEALSSEEAWLNFYKKIL